MLAWRKSRQKAVFFNSVPSAAPSLEPPTHPRRPSNGLCGTGGAHRPVGQHHEAQSPPQRRKRCDGNLGEGSHWIAVGSGEGSAKLPARSRVRPARDGRGLCGAGPLWVVCLHPWRTYCIQAPSRSKRRQGCRKWAPSASVIAKRWNSWATSHIGGTRDHPSGTYLCAGGRTGGSNPPRTASPRTPPHPAVAATLAATRFAPAAASAEEASWCRSRHPRRHHPCRVQSTVVLSTPR